MKLAGDVIGALIDWVEPEIAATGACSIKISYCLNGRPCTATVPSLKGQACPKMYRQFWIWANLKKLSGVLDVGTNELVRGIPTGRY